jgi:hypothetical protein
LDLRVEAADIFVVVVLISVVVVLLFVFVLDLVDFRMLVFLDPFLRQLYAVLCLLL